MAEQPEADVGPDANKRHKYDYNFDGIVDNEEYLAGHDTGIEVQGHSSIDLTKIVADDDGEETWHPRQVFDKLEEARQADAQLLPDQVPGICHTVIEYAVSPLEPWRLSWNVLVLGVVVYSCIQVPYDAAVQPLVGASLLDFLVDLIFYLDMGLNFFTGYDVGYEVVMNKRRIVIHYLSGWFPVDLAATVDWATVLSWFFAEEDLPDWVKMLGLLKILRLARAGRLIDTLSSRWSTHSGYVEAGKFLLYVCVVAHLLACFFFMWPYLIGENLWLLGSPECAKDEIAAADARSCIDNGGFDADGNECDMFSAVGWYYKGACMQGSWREQQGLEQICLPQVCDGLTENGDWNYAVGDGFTLQGSGSESLTKCSDGKPSRSLTDEESRATLLMCFETAEEGRHRTDPNHRVCPKCTRPVRLYIDSLYWSLTTMTTIGYGDRGPKTESEITYTIFAEVFGLAFFALLLTQINNVNELLGSSTRDAKDTKDGILQFLAQRRIKSELTSEVVKFLSFRSSSFSGNTAQQVEETQFLSKGLQSRIKTAIYVPLLKKISFFGWSHADEKEYENVRLFFNRIDDSGDGQLDKEEVGQLFGHLGIQLSSEQFTQVFKELDRDDEGLVEFDEFSWWWFKTKYGVPRFAGARAPDVFLNALAGRLQPKMFSAKDRMVSPEEYGTHFVLLLTGNLRVLRPGVLPGAPGSDPDDPKRITTRDFFIKPDDRRPMFGYSACLTKLQYELIKSRTDNWAIDAETYVDSLWCKRKHLYKCFENHWLKGREDMVEMCYHHYEVELILNPRTLIDHDGDGVVSHEEFLEASAVIPHGFASHFAHRNRRVIKQAKERGLTVKGTLDVDSLHHHEQVHEDTKATAESLLENEELVRLKVSKLDAVAAQLQADVGAVKQGMLKLLQHNAVTWEEAEAKEGEAETKSQSGDEDEFGGADPAVSTFDVEPASAGKRTAPRKLINKLKK